MKNKKGIYNTNLLQTNKNNVIYNDYYKTPKWKVFHRNWKMNKFQFINVTIKRKIVIKTIPFNDIKAMNSI